MKKRMLALVLSGLMLTGTLVGCGGDKKTPAGGSSAGGSSAAGGDGEYEITTICMALNSDYWHMVEAGAKLAGKELGVKVNVIGPNAESDSATQINMVEDAVNNKVDAIVLAANEPTSLVSAAQTVKNAGIPLVLIDAMLNTEDESLYSCFVGTGNLDAGRQGGEFIASKLQKGDKVAIIRGLVGQTVHDQRSEGAQKAMEEAGLEVVAVQPADSDRGKAVNVAENIIQANPDIKAFYSTNDDMALGAYQAVAAAGMKDVVVVGFDGTFNAMDSIEKGEMSGSVAQQPIEEGYQGVVNAVKILKGESVEKQQPLDVVVLSKDNVADFRAEVEAKIEESGVKLG
ncbi:MAG: sugar ABC transporter substrate-binding protein [Clostridiaceae bacterium]|nr:sugar ABC transporter substrate-binding protein [Clostridiaceae bacterium]